MEMRNYNECFQKSNKGITQIQEFIDNNTQKL